MNRICRKCGNDISEGRLKALPNTKICVNCSNINKKKGFNVISGDEDYSELQIIDDESFKELNEKQSQLFRYTKKHRYSIDPEQ